MSYYIVRDYNYERQNDFIIDTDEDVALLPTSTVGNVKTGKGSMALSIATGNLFVLNSEDEWVKVGTQSDNVEESSGGES